MKKFGYSKKSKLFRLWFLGFVVFIILWIYPIHYRIIRLGILILTPLLFLLGPLFLLWKHKIPRILVIFLIICLGIFLILPGRKSDGNLLRQNYIWELNKFIDTRYIWGGENKIGIDCSGLVREGLIHAEVKHGLQTLNPKLIRHGFSLWWHDATAKALRDEYHHYTKRWFEARSINQLDHKKILPGDMAVTTDGVHIMAYIGNKTWIEADPNIQKVIRVKVPDKHNPWFNLPIYILQWTEFDN